MAKKTTGGIKEKLIHDSIKNWVIANGGICKKIQSGAVYQRYKARGGQERINKIKFENKGTTDLVVDIWGECFWVEVKKNRSEYEVWVKLFKRYEKEGLLPKSYDRELAQIQERKSILECWGKHVITYSSEHFEEMLKIYFEEKAKEEEEKKKAIQEEVIERISCGEGWEESGDKYRKLYNLPLKYEKWSTK